MDFLLCTWWDENILKCAWYTPCHYHHHRRRRCTLNIAISASISSFYSTHFRVVIFHYFIMCTLIPRSMATRRFIILHMSLKFRPRFFTKWLPFSILCNFSAQCSCLSAKKKYKNEMKEAFLLISWQISIANFTAVVSSVGFDHQYTVFTAFSLLPFPSSLQLHSWCVFSRLQCLMMGGEANKKLLNCDRSAKWERKKNIYERIFVIACRLNSMIHETKKLAGRQTHQSSMPLDEQKERDLYEILDSIRWRE